MNPILAFAAAAAALAAPAAAQKPTTVVPVELRSFGYSPSPIVLGAGEPVTMVFTNRSGMGHTFKAQTFFGSARILSGSPHVGEIHMKAGQSTSVTLIPTRGAYPVHCSHFFHDQLGMRTTLYVR